VSATLARPARQTTHDLVRFLLARFDEDDHRLKRLARSAADQLDSEYGSIERLRAEALARRRIVGSVQQLLVLRDQPSEKPVRDGAAQILKALAAPYTGHAAFRPEWKTSARA
jgi:Family of unknown function (DUF6221)